MSKANDDIPADEMTLAKLLQNAGAYGLKWTRGALYRNTSRHACSIEAAAACCALGAARIKDDDITILPHTAANDYPDVLWGDGHSSPEVELGHSFREAMRSK